MRTIFLLKNRISIAGYMTVYLSLTMTVLLSLCLTLIEGARSSAIKLESEVAVEVSLDSVLSEYNRELARQYNIFGIDDSYGTDSASLNNLLNHLETYLYKNTTIEDVFLSEYFYRDFVGVKVKDSQINGVMYLSDDNGAVFRRRAFEAIKDDIGLTLLSELSEWVADIESQGLEDMDLLGQLEDLQGQAAQAQGEVTDEDREEERSPEDINEGEDISTDPDPAGATLSTLNAGLLWMVVGDTSSLSGKSLNKETLISSRIKNGTVAKGNLELEEEQWAMDMVEKFVFQEYLLKYMGYYGGETDEDVLEYQIEYIIAGGDNDISNLTNVAARIFGVRYAADYLYILSDQEKVSTAETWADLLSYVTYTEEMADVYKNIFLLVWACAEARFDTKAILEGSRIPLVKAQDTWHSSLLHGITCSIPSTDNLNDGGLSYKDYLRIFMFLMSDDTLNIRAMDMVEADIRVTEGNDYFRMDACVDSFESKITTYSNFGYEYSFSRKRKYE